MKKILCICAAGLLGLTACQDFLNTSSPSVVDADFIFSNMTTARSVMDGAYESWRNCCENQLYGCGLFYATDMAGSDMDTHPENFDKQPGRHTVETLFRNGTIAGSYGLDSYSKVKSSYEGIYEIAARVNSIITSMEQMDTYTQYVTEANEPSEFSQLYGEAIALRASVFREGLRQFGDMPISFAMGIPGVGLTNRDSIYDCLIADLKKVEPLMYDLGSNPAFASANKNYFSRTYVAGLVGRICLDAAGYQTRRNDMKYTDGKGNPLQFETMGTENNGATYGRRTDWKSFYQTAKEYFEKCMAHAGTAIFYKTDPRSNSGNRVYDNPYQYFFQQMHDNDAAYADESIYEYPMQAGTTNNARGYDLGRASDGAERNAYPCKVYSQCRAVPAFYYGMYDPKDKRRDVTYSVTGSNGDGTEKLVSFEKGSKITGGITLNKWDPNRQPVPQTAVQRVSGINGPYMRMSEIYLSYAEACAILGDEANAKQYLTLIRERSFPAGEAKVDQFIAKNGSLFNAIIQERAFELGGDGDRRWTLLRTGLFPQKIKETKELTKAMLDGLKANGYYEFENGNVISSYIWTKSVDAKSIYGYRLTTQCPEGMEGDPVLYPGWRGQHDSWETFGCNYKTDSPKTNLAIKGLFKHIEPGSAEALALEADGYTKIAWGAQLIDNKGITKYDMEYEYYTTFFYDYDYVKAPLYLYPFPTAILTAGNITNGYGYKNLY